MSATAPALRANAAPATEPAALDESTLERMYAQARRCEQPGKYIQPVIPIEHGRVLRDARQGAAGEADLPDAATWCYRLVPAVLECLAGLRPASQLARMVTPEIRTRLARRSAIARRRGIRGVHAPQVIKVHVCRPAARVAEVVVVVHLQGRSRAVAVRLEGLDDRWMTTSFVYG